MTVQSEKPKNHSVFTRDNFNELSTVHDPHCISIYIPTAESGVEVDEGHAKITLKNALKQVEQELRNYEMDDHSIEAYLKPAKYLLDEVHFWRNQSQGLAIFLTDTESTAYPFLRSQPVRHQ